MYYIKKKKKLALYLNPNLLLSYFLDIIFELYILSIYDDASFSWSNVILFIYSFIYVFFFVCFAIPKLYFNIIYK